MVVSRRARWVALVVVLFIIVGASALLAVRQANTWDETQTLAQTHDSTLSTLRASCASTFDTCPATYYGGVWALSRAGVGLLGLRAVTILGWVVGSAALGAIMIRRQGGLGSVIVATAGMSASGLLGQSMVARPYGLTVGALACGVCIWERSFARPSRAGAILLAVTLTLATALHYSTLIAVGCVLVAEILALRWDRTRTKTYLGAILACLGISALLGIWIRQSMNAASGGASGVSVTSLPRFYLSVIQPSLAPLVIVAIAGAGWWLVRRNRSASAASGARNQAQLGARAVYRARTSPFVVLIVLLATVVPVLVIAGIAVTNGQYFHRYALGGLVGLVLIAAEVTRQLEKSHPGIGIAAALVVVAAIPIEWVGVTNDEGPTRRDVAAVARGTGVLDHNGAVLVQDAYLRVLLSREVDGEVADHLELGGPADTIIDRPVFDLADAPKAGEAPRRVLLVVRADDLAQYEAAGRVVVQRRIGSAHLSYGSVDDEIVGAEVTVVPS